MRRVTLVHDARWSSFVIDDNVSTLDDLLRQMSVALAINVTEIHTKVEGVRCKIESIGAIKDSDVLYTSETKAEEGRRRRDWIKINVGGQLFVTSRTTLEARGGHSMLARMMAAADGGMEAGTVDEDGAILIDREPTYFRPLLNYLRTGELIMDHSLNPHGVLMEARYFGIAELIPRLEELVFKSTFNLDEAPLTRRDVIKAIIPTPCSREMRFQGVNLMHADLSKLDLRHINFKYANMKGCNLSGTNLSWCNLERADLSGSKLDGAQLLGVKMVCANLEGCSMKGCNFDDPAGSSALMEGVNLRGADLEGSNMAAVNLRVATLKHGNMRNCDLRSAVLAGADLEFCDLSGSDLHEANLRGANLKDTTLELMQTPLHMSQTIR